MYADGRSRESADAQVSAIRSCSRSSRLARRSGTALAPRLPTASLTLSREHERLARDRRLETGKLAGRHGKLRQHQEPREVLQPAQVREQVGIGPVKAQVDTKLLIDRGGSGGV